MLCGIVDLVLVGSNENNRGMGSMYADRIQPKAQTRKALGTVLSVQNVHHVKDNLARGGGSGGETKNNGMMWRTWEIREKGKITGRKGENKAEKKKGR